MLKKFLYMALLGAVMTSCSENLMDEINKDESNPPASSVNAKFQITDAIVGAGYSTWGGAYAWYVASFTEQIFGTGNNQLMKAELRMRSETAASSTYNNEWNATYGNLMNIKQIIEKCEEGGVNSGQLDLKGMAQVLWTLSFEALTDLHGDIPYSEALGGSRQPKLDSQESIYTDLLKRIDDAIANIKAAEAAGMNNAAGQDLLYGGNLTKWKGFAYAVKARLLLNTLYRNPSVLTDVLAAANEALSAGFDGAELTIFNGVDCDNSWTAYNWSRYYSGACGTVAELMAERNDPRYDVYACDLFGTGIDYAPAGDDVLAKSTETVGFPTWLENGAATMHLLSKSELYFIVAEAKARLGQDASAELAEAITASFEDYALSDGGMIGFDPSSAADYIASIGSASLAEIMVQKYIAQARDEQIQTYNDIRRCKALGQEFITLQNPNNTSGGQNQWPLRLPYGNSDVVSNPNVSAAFGSGNEAGNYLFTENVWLFGGSR